MNFPIWSMPADKHLVGGKDHIVEVRNRVDQFHFDVRVFQRPPQAFPLLLCLNQVDRASHVRILGLADIEECGRTH